MGTHSTGPTLHALGWTAVAIAAELGLHPKTVRRYRRCTDLQPQHRKKRRHLLDPYKPYLRQRWQEGCRTGATLYQEIKQRGYTGGITQLRSFLQTLQGQSSANQNPDADLAVKWRQLSLRQLAFFMGRPVETWSQEQGWIGLGLERLAEKDESLAETIELARVFTQMVSQQKSEQFDGWLKQAKSSKAVSIRRFALGLEADRAAIEAALRLKWSNGPVEGIINRLKTLKRQMYGRANLDLLKIRMMGRQPL